MKQNKMENNEIKGQAGFEASVDDLKNASIIFAQALNLMLDEKQGVVVDVNKNIALPEGVKKIVVFKHTGNINIFRCDDDIKEGTIVNILDQTEE